MIWYVIGKIRCVFAAFCHGNEITTAIGRMWQHLAATITRVCETAWTCQFLDKQHIKTNVKWKKTHSAKDDGVWVRYVITIRTHCMVADMGLDIAVSVGCTDAKSTTAWVLDFMTASDSATKIGLQVNKLRKVYCWVWECTFLNR